jgi:hypothetical protein
VRVNLKKIDAKFSPTGLPGEVLNATKLSNYNNLAPPKPPPVGGLKKE